MAKGVSEDRLAHLLTCWRQTTGYPEIACWQRWMTGLAGKRKPWEGVGERRRGEGVVVWGLPSSSHRYTVVFAAEGCALLHDHMPLKADPFQTLLFAAGLLSVWEWWLEWALCRSVTVRLCDRSSASKSMIRLSGVTLWVPLIVFVIVFPPNYSEPLSSMQLHKYMCILAKLNLIDFVSMTF